MTQKIKIELDGSIIRLYYYKKTWLVFGGWIPYYNKHCGSVYDAYVEFEKINIKVNPFFKPNHN